MPDIFEEDAFYFVPLGGSEEFGCNLNLYVCDGDFLAIDCGIGFADERAPGIDILLPDPYLLEEYQDNLKGLVITHAHEDHIGGVAHLWPRFECPIYASRFTAAVLQKKFEQEGVRGATIYILNDDDDIKIGNFSVRALPVSHSVPDSRALLIKTSYGSILHSGDWNLDPAPILGVKTEEERFAALGRDGVLAYIGDSTNAQVDGFSGSEQDVATGLADEFRGCTGKIAVTTFSSNIGRIVSIVRAAEEVGRSVALIGRSLHRMVGCAYECGYITDLPEFLSEDDLSYIASENLVLIVTGSQGEARAALSRISRGDHRSVSLGHNDTVIFSARAIPGNERAINSVKNNLVAAGVRVISPKETQNVIHVSGHPCRAEIAQMLQWIKPKYVVPVHGERTQLDAHAKFAKSCQVNDVVVPNNGSVIRLAPGKAEIVDHVETGILAVDQRRIIPITHQSITARRKLQYSGAVHASIVLDSGLALLSDIKIDTVGLSCERAGDSMIDDLERHLLAGLDIIDPEDGFSDEEIAEELRIRLRKYVCDRLGLKPKTTVHVTTIRV